ncbi:MAG: hypothetical protein LBU73_07330 [Helicobacteraceae bacterium]|jgi:hypothetical protein|nr:hypothetical protein [Helicobacteraceae bacterium]
MWDLGIALPIAVGENVVIRPALNYLFTNVSIKQETCSLLSGCKSKTEKYRDSILLPAIGAEYHIPSVRAGVFVGAELSAPQPKSGAKEFYEFERDGIGYGIFVGFSADDPNTKHGGSVRLGYRSIPVKVTYGGFEESKNFGGVAFTVGFRF